MILHETDDKFLPTVSEFESVESISFFPKLGNAHKVKKSLDLTGNFFCVHQQHITKEAVNFFWPKKFFFLNYSKKTMKIKLCFLSEAVGQS